MRIYVEDKNLLTSDRARLIECRALLTEYRSHFTGNMFFLEMKITSFLMECRVLWFWWNTGLFKFDGIRALLIEYRALLMEWTALFHRMQGSFHRMQGSFDGISALLIGCRALLMEWATLLHRIRGFFIKCRALVMEYRALFMESCYFS